MAPLLQMISLYDEKLTALVRVPASCQFPIITH